MKKIALLGPNLENPGGINVVVKFLEKGLEKENYKIHYLVSAFLTQNFP